MNRSGQMSVKVLKLFEPTQAGFLSLQIVFSSYGVRIIRRPFNLEIIYRSSKVFWCCLGVKTLDTTRGFVLWLLTKSFK